MLLRAEITDLEGAVAGAHEELEAAHRLCDTREAQRDAAREAADATAAEIGALETALAEAAAALDAAREDTRAAVSSAQRHAGESVTWAARAQAAEAVGDANARAAASEHAALVDGLSELDDAVRRASADTERGQVETGLLVRALEEAESARGDLAAELIATRVQMETRRIEEERQRQARLGARTKQQEHQQAALTRELRSLQRQLVPQLALGGPSVLATLEAPSADADELWAGLLGGGGGGGGGHSAYFASGFHSGLQSGLGGAATPAFDFPSQPPSRGDSASYAFPSRGARTFHGLPRASH